VTPQPPEILRPFPEWESRIRAGFSTRLGGFSSGNYSGLNLGFRSGDDPQIVNRNWDAVRSKFGLVGKPLILPNLVHGDALADADFVAAEAEPAGSPIADAVFSRSSAGILAVTMADCLTALIFDPESNTIAAVHAGWRGTNLGILGKSLRTLTAKGLIAPENTLVAFGPCLRPQSMEVGQEVASQLDSVFVIRRGSRFYFNLPECNRAQALHAGILPGNLRDVGGDTLQEPDRFFSFRREGRASGRMAAFISLV
jgi:YfiH family protein